MRLFIDPEKVKEVARKFNQNKSFVYKRIYETILPRQDCQEWLDKSSSQGWYNFLSTPLLIDNPTVHTIDRDKLNRVTFGYQVINPVAVPSAIEMFLLKVSGDPVQNYQDFLDTASDEDLVDELLCGFWAFYGGEYATLRK